MSTLRQDLREDSEDLAKDMREIKASLEIMTFREDERITGGGRDGDRTAGSSSAFFAPDEMELRSQLADAAAEAAVSAAVAEVEALSGEASGLLPLSGAAEAEMQSELAALESKNEALRRRLNQAITSYEVGAGAPMPQDLSAAQGEILALRNGVKSLYDALLEPRSTIGSFADRKFGALSPRSAAGAGVPLPASGGSGEDAGERVPTESEIALELEVQELTHSALSLELEDLLKTNIALVNAPAREPEPEPEPQPAPSPENVALAAEVAKQGERLDALSSQVTGLRQSQAPTGDAAVVKVGFADGTKAGAPKKLVRQQTGIGQSAPPSVDFAGDTKSGPSRRVVRQHTGMHTSSPHKSLISSGVDRGLGCDFRDWGDWIDGRLR